VFETIAPRKEATGVIDDFEYHDERSLRKSDPEIDLYVAIQEKYQTYGAAYAPLH
jgi:predicted transcriptional regulator YdeE